MVNKYAGGGGQAEQRESVRCALGNGPRLNRTANCCLDSDRVYRVKIDALGSLVAGVSRAGGVPPSFNGLDSFGPLEVDW